MLPANLFTPLTENIVSALANGSALSWVAGLPASLDHTLCDAIGLASTKTGRPLRWKCVYLGNSIEPESLKPWLENLIAQDVFDDHPVPATFLVDLGDHPSPETLDTTSQLTNTELATRIVLVCRSAAHPVHDSASKPIEFTAEHRHALYLWAAGRATLRPKLSTESISLLEACKENLFDIILTGHHAHLSLGSSDGPSPVEFLASQNSSETGDTLNLLSALPQPMSQEALRLSLQELSGVTRATTDLSELRNRGWLSEPYRQSSESPALWYLHPHTQQPGLLDRTVLTRLAHHYTRALTELCQTRFREKLGLDASQRSLCSHGIETIRWARTLCPDQVAELALELESVATSTGQLQTLSRAVSEHPSMAIAELRARAALAYGHSDDDAFAALANATSPEARLLHARHRLAQTELSSIVPSLEALSTPQMLSESESARNAGLLLGRHYLVTGAFNDARMLGEAISTASRASHDSLRIALATLLVGLTHCLDGDIEKKATAYLRESLRLLRTLELPQHARRTQRVLERHLERARSKPIASASPADFDLIQNCLLLNAQVWAVSR